VTQFHDFVLSTITSAEDEKTSTITIPAGTRFQSIDVREVAGALVTLAEQPACRITWERFLQEQVEKRA